MELKREIRDLLGRFVSFWGDGSVINAISSGPNCRSLDKTGKRELVGASSLLLKALNITLFKYSTSTSDRRSAL